jgi:hypothetical protein
LRYVEVAVVEFDEPPLGGTTLGELNPHAPALARQEWLVSTLLEIVEEGCSWIRQGHLSRTEREDAPLVPFG